MRALAVGVAAYLAASAVESVVYWEWHGGHADVPFTDFPGYFVFAPVLPPVVIFRIAVERDPRDLAATAAFGITAAVVWRLLARPRGSRGAREDARRAPDDAAGR